MDIVYSEERLKQYISEVSPTKNELYQYAHAKWNSIAKTIRGMGILEEDIAKIISLLGDIKTLNKCVAVMCADNGIVEEGVTQTDSSVTSVVAHNITVGKASVTNMADIAGADVYAYDLGMCSDVDSVTNRKCANGTNNFLKEPAMTREKTAEAIIKGIEIAGELKGKGYNIIACGEMGIGNTTTASAITAVLFNVDPVIVTGRGAGLEKEKILHKANVIQQAIKLHEPQSQDVLDVLSKVGGFDIAAMCGLFIGGAIYKIPVIIDGFISSVSALLAKMLCKDTVSYMIASHMSAEPASEMVMQELGLVAPIQAGMALGEGTGAVAVMPLLDMALKVFCDMPTFQDISIEEYKEFDEEC